MTYSIASLFQNRVQYPQVSLMSGAALKEAYDNASLGQLPNKSTSIEKLAKSILKDMQLWSIQKVAYTDDGEAFLYSGRNRYDALEFITKNYGVSPTGDLVKITEVNVNDLEPIEFNVYVDKCEVAGIEEVSQLILAENGSRAVKGEEKILIESAGGDTSNLSLLDLATKFRGMVSRVSLTATTSLAFVKGSLAKVANNRYASNEQKLDIIKSMSNFLNDTANELPENISYGCSKVIGQWVLAGFADTFVINKPEKVIKATKEDIKAAELSKIKSDLEAANAKVLEEFKAKMVATFGLNPQDVDSIA